MREADAERTRAERARLLYVATTRARDRLHVVYQLSPSREEPKSDTLLKLLQPMVAAELAATQARDDVRPPSDAPAIEPMLRRLARVAAPSGDAEPAPTTATSATGAQFALPFDARATGAAAAARVRMGEPRRGACRNRRASRAATDRGAGD